MAFTGPAITLVGLLKIEMPLETVRLCDGGFCYFGGEKYTSRDAKWGTVAGIDPVTEGLGDEAPGGRIRFYPPDATEADELTSGALQFSRIRGWLGELSSDGKTISHAEQLIDMLWDTSRLVLTAGQRSLDVTTISRAEKFFLSNEGNTLSDGFHRSIWGGELGLQNANGLTGQVAWGADSPPRGSVVAANSGFGGAYGAGAKSNQYEFAPL